MLLFFSLVWCLIFTAVVGRSRWWLVVDVVGRVVVGMYLEDVDAESLAQCKSTRLALDSPS